MVRTSIVFSLFILLIVTILSFTFSEGYVSGEIENNIVKPISKAAELFVQQATKIPEPEIVQNPITVQTTLPKIDPEIEKNNAFYKATNQAHQHFAEGNFSAVLEDATNALGNAITDKDKAIAHYWLGLGYYRQGDLVKAESEEKMAIVLDPKYAAPYVTLSGINMNRGDYVKGLALAQKAQEIDPKYPWVYNNQGIALVMLGRKNEGLEMFRKAIQLAPDSYIFKDNLTRAQEVD